MKCIWSRCEKLFIPFKYYGGRVSCPHCNRETPIHNPPEGKKSVISFLSHSSLGLQQLDNKIYNGWLKQMNSDGCTSGTVGISTRFRRRRSVINVGNVEYRERWKNLILGYPSRRNSLFSFANKLMRRISYSNPPEGVIISRLPIRKRRSCNYNKQLFDYDEMYGSVACSHWLLLVFCYATSNFSCQNGERLF